MDADTTHVSFVAHNAGVREAIEAQLPRLRSLLEASGLQLGDVDVNQSGSQDERRPAGQPQGHGGRRGTSSLATSKVGASDVGESHRHGRDNALIDVHA